jgi:hypothetical protein
MKPADPALVHARFLVIKQRGLERGAREHAEHLAKIKALKLLPEERDGMGNLKQPNRTSPAGENKRGRPLSTTGHNQPDD